VAPAPTAIEEEPEQQPTPTDEFTLEEPTATPEPTATEEPTAPPTETPVSIATPALNEPAEGAEVPCEEPVTLRWSQVEVDGATVRYAWELQIAEQGDTTADPTPTPPPDDELVFVDLTSDTTDETEVELEVDCDRRYRWRVQAVTDSASSDFSDYRRFNTGLQPTATPTPTATPDTEPPPVPDLDSPLNDAGFDCTDSVSLQWNEVEDDSGIDRYDWEVFSTTGGRGGSYSYDEGGSATSNSVGLSPFSCDPGPTWYRWRVRAVDNEGNESDYSDFNYFEVRGP
jgi:hypothetical protein